ncbi:hypothetical protein MBLNU459_g0305t1 [Dothideomycetes sp. NU459]
MLLNEHTALLTSSILLCPYSKHHVPTYHEWMQDEVGSVFVIYHWKDGSLLYNRRTPILVSLLTVLDNTSESAKKDLQALTASEPLTLPEEYAMQESWRKDSDKLTFIVCLPSSPLTPDTIIATQEDAPSRMIGDINLFLSEYDSSDSESEGTVTTNSACEVVGEIEIMIASRPHHRQGYGRAALLTFLWYVLERREPILREYDVTITGNGDVPGAVTFKYLRVKIGQENAKSIALFESVGFERTSAGPNYFGEVELRFSAVEGALRRVELAKGFEVVRVVEYEFEK